MKPSEKKFGFYFIDGSFNKTTAESVSEAFSKLGFGRGAVSML